MAIDVTGTGAGAGAGKDLQNEDNIKRGKAFALAPKSINPSKKYANDQRRDSASKAEDRENFRLVPTDKSRLGLWEQAWEQVKDDEKDWKLWPQFQGIKDLKTKDVVNEVHGFAQRRRDDAEKNQAHAFGASLTYRKMCSKVAKSAKNFEIVGDLVVQAEPVYAALPWTLVRFVIECAVGESDTWDSMLEGTDRVTTHISKYPVIEQLYANIDSELSKGLRDSLLKFFVFILKFQIHTVKYFDPDHKGRRTALGMNPITADGIKKELQTVEEAREVVDRNIVLVDAEVTKLGIDNLKEGQEGQQEQLKAIKEGISALSRDIDRDFSKAERNQQERHKDLIEMWKGPLDQMKENAELHSVEMEKKYLIGVRRWLSVAKPWEDYKKAKEQRRMSLGKWLTVDSEYVRWRCAAKSSMLWLHGFAGTGKTGLVCRVIEDLSHTLENEGTGQDTSRLAIFYCSNDKAKTGREETFYRADPKEALRSIVSQLSTTKKDQDVAQIVRDKYESFGPGSDNQMPLEYSDCVEVLIEISKSTPIVVVLDGFDECDQDKSPTLIKHLQEVIRQSPNHVKVFISTRSFPAIEIDLKAGPSIAVTAERNKDDVGEFIEKTLDDRIKDGSLLNGVVEPALKEKIKNTLTSRARNMFLYASLLLNQLCDKNHTNDPESISKKLDELPKDLKEMYKRIMGEIHDDKNNSRRSCHLAQDTFKWLLHAQRPLEYRSFLEAVSPPERKADWQEVLDVCRTLVVRESDTFTFAHYSVREHLVQMEQYTPSQCNIVATRSCLRILNTFSGADETTRQRLSEPEKSFREYALLYWPLHYEGIALADIGEHRATINAMLRSFLLNRRGDRHKYQVYEEWFRDAQRMAESLEDNKYVASKFRTMRADPPTPLFAACVFGLEDLIAKFGREMDRLNTCNQDGQNALCLAIENNKLEVVRALLSRRFPADLNLLNVSAVQQFEDWDPAKPPKVILYASPLQCAAANGRLDIAKILIEEGAHIDLVAGYYGSPLQAACLRGHGAIVDLLLRKGAEPNSQGGFHGCALQAAAAGGHTDIITLLLENKPPALVGTPGGHYGFALVAAVCSGSSDAVAVLLEEEANPSVRNKTYGTPLEKAVSMGQASKDIIRLLVDYEAEADLSPSGKKVHILHRAALLGIEELITYCLGKRCQIDMITTEGPNYNPKLRFNWFPREMTPLAYGCAEGHLGVVKTLLERGAPFEEDRPYSAPLWAAAYQGHAEVVDLLITKFRETHDERDTIAFMDHLPDPDAGRHFILFAAASSGNADVVKVLLDHRVPYRSNWFASTPLVATATFGCAAATKLLLDYHKDGRVDVRLDQTNRIGRTALYEACVGGRLDIASQLLDAGADLFIPNDQNATILHKICQQDNQMFLEKLVNKALENRDDAHFRNFLDTRHRPTGNTALIDCAERNKLSALVFLLDSGADPMIRNNENLTALHLACRHGNISLVEPILNKVQEKTDQSEFLKFINQQPASAMTALIECAAINDTQTANLLLKKGADYTLHGHFGNTPLLWSSGRGHYDMVSMLVKHAKIEDRESCPFKDVINHQNKDGVNALFEAAKKNYSPTVHLLLEEGIDWSIANKGGVTALHAASWEGNPEVVSALLAKAYSTSNREGFESFLNRRNFRGTTALLDAAERGRTGIVKQLLEKYDADFLIRADEERTALNLACCEGHADVVTFLLSFASTKLPRDRFVEFLNHRNKGGNTAIKDAAERGQLRCVEALLDQRYGADFRLDNVNGGTPLIRSSNSGYKEVVSALLKAAHDRLNREDFQTFIDHRNKWGKTALMDAAENNRAPVIDLLLAHDADFTLGDNNDFTALHYCAFRNHMAAVRTLLKGASQARSDDGSRFRRFLNQQSKDNRATALRDAAIQKHTGVAMLLLEYEPAYDPIDSGKRTALHHAVGRGAEEFAVKLLEYAGRDRDRDRDGGRGERFRRFVNAVEDRGDTVWKGAKRRGMQVLLQRLRACGVVEGAEFLG